MLPTPSSSPARPSYPLNDATNASRETQASRPPLNPWFQLPTPPKHAGTKRLSCTESNFPSKRVKHNNVEDREDSSDEEELWISRVKTRKRRKILRNDLFGQPFASCSSWNDSTRLVLKSLVSSHKSDFFRCESLDSVGFLTPPYACSYSHNAKRGGVPLLAVSTEQGAVHIINTRKRLDWDPEPPRTSLQPHSNGIFDVKWNMSDTLLATCSGDQLVRITCPSTTRTIHTLRGHTSSVKCASWHPQNDNILSTGGRDGSIRIWDLRAGDTRGEDASLAPVMTIPCAHEALEFKVRRGKNAPAPKSVTNLIFRENMSVISSGSSDGVLRSWDLRSLDDFKKSKGKRVLPTYFSSVDPTASHSSRRPRGILSLASGAHASSGLIFALTADSRIHTYSMSSLTPLPADYMHANLHTNSSFYLGLSVSPCGRWLASGSGGPSGSSFLFDIAGASQPYPRTERGVELKAQKGEISAVDWADGMLATCADDGTVRVWRPDIEVYRGCLEDPEEKRWEWYWSTSDL